jgi:hypothetical protein
VGGHAAEQQIRIAGKSVDHSHSQRWLTGEGGVGAAPNPHRGSFDAMKSGQGGYRGL